MTTFHQEIDLRTATPSTVPIIDAKNIGFQASKVYIDNYTSYYFYLRDALAYIPPWWLGAVWKLYHTTDWAYVDLKSPFSATQSPTDPSYFLRLVWTDEEEVPLSQGSSSLGTSISVNIGPPPISVTVNSKAGIVPVTQYTVACSSTRADLVPAVRDFSSIMIYNDGSKTAYIGEYATVSASTGIPLAAGAYYVYDLDSTAIHMLGAICSGTDTTTLRVFVSTVQSA